MEYNNPFSLQGKTILVTGASSGIGQATAVACAQMGADVVITGRDAERLQATADLMGEAKGQIVADLIVQEDVDKLVAALPPLDGAVLCAGNSTTLPLQFGTREKFDDMFDVNFFAPVELLRLMYKKKVLQKGASVVLIASIGGTHSFMPGNGVYGASKAALNSVMKYAAREYASRKVRARVWWTRRSSIAARLPRNSLPKTPSAILWAVMVAPTILLMARYTCSVTRRRGSQAMIWSLTAVSQYSFF